MEINTPYVFQADSDIVNRIYEQPNYLIEYNENLPNEYCVFYFSSNDLYYPNSEIAFSESVVRKKRFEWYGTRIAKGHKHVFVRDIKKQWYLSGINSEVDTPGKLFSFLKELSSGYKVITVGASAGGFAAVLYGQMLGAENIFSFNGQFEIKTLLEKSNYNTDPIVFRYHKKQEFSDYYDTVNFINNPSSIFYFQSLFFAWDVEQGNHVSTIPINKIAFKTGKHGIPFLKTNLKSVLNLSETELNALVGKVFHPLLFSIKMVGILKTIQGLNSILQFVLNKIYIRTFQKWKKNFIVK